MLLDQKWDVSETNHHIAFIKDCNCSMGKLVTGKLNKWYIHLYLQCRLISQTMYLKKVIFFAWGQRPADNVQPLTALQDVNSQKRCSRLLRAHLQVQVFGWLVCFLKVFFGKIMVSSLPRSHARMMWRPQKTSNLTMLPLMMQTQLWCRRGSDRHKLLSFIIFQHKKWKLI